MSCKKNPFQLIFKGGNNFVSDYEITLLDKPVITMTVAPNVAIGMVRAMNDAWNIAYELGFKDGGDFVLHEFARELQ